MIELLRARVVHKGHADASMLAAVGANAAAAADPEVHELFFHVLLANRFWLATLRGLPFNRDEESRADGTVDGMVRRYRSTHQDEVA